MLTARSGRPRIVASWSGRPGWSERGERWAPFVVLTLGLIAQAAALVHYARRLWFFGDDWEFLLRRSLTDDTVHSLFAPHNEHWSTVPVIAFRLLFSIFGLSHYLPYALMPIAAHLVTVVLLFWLLRRHGVGPWPAVAATLVTAFLAGGAGAENTLWDFQIGFIGSCLFGVAALLLLTFPGRWFNVLAVLALLISLMCSGLGLIMTAWAGLVVLFRRGLLGALSVVAVPAVVYVVWYLLIGHERPPSAVPDPVLTIAPVAAVTGIGDVWSVATGMTAAGPAILLALIATTALARLRVPRLFVLALAGLICFALAFALFGYTRSGLGATATDQGRYQYLALLLSGPAVAAAMALAGRALRTTPWAGLAAGVVTLGLVCSLGVAQLGQFVTGRNSTTLPQLKGRLDAALAYADSRSTLLGTAPDVMYNPDITIDRLLSPKVRSTLPHVRPTAIDKFQVEAALEAGISGDSTGLPSFETVSWGGFPGVTNKVRPLDRCRTHVAGPGASVTFGPLPGGGQAVITSHGPAVQTQVVKGVRPSDPAGRFVPADRPVYAASRVADATFRVYLPAGPITVCPA